MSRQEVRPAVCVVRDGQDACDFFMVLVLAVVSSGHGIVTVTSELKMMWLGSETWCSVHGIETAWSRSGQSACTRAHELLAARTCVERVR
jgi:hypothetical protein